jgi:tripartite-type tricarboxylate transporter receptor subunit TctC
MGNMGSVFALPLVFAIAMAAAHAQPFPSRPVSLIVPFPPGGIDGVVRVVAQKAAERLGQPVIVDNKPGASGLIAAQFVKSAGADGHTLLLGHTGTHAVNPTLYSKLPYDPVRDFDPVASLFSTPHLLVVPPDSPARSVADLIALARGRPQGLTFASQGIGTGGHLLGEMLRARTGVALTHVPYKGTAPAQADVIAGRVDLYFDGLVTGLPQVRAGKMRALAIAARGRSRQAGEIPTMAESGTPGIELDFWFAVFAPAGTPRTAIGALNSALVETMRHPEIVGRMNALALDITAGSADELAAAVQADAARLGKVVRDAGAKAD